MKKSLITLLTIPLLLSGCSLFGGGGDENDPNSETGSKKLSIRFHVDESSAEGQGYKKLIDQFNTEHAAEEIMVTPDFRARSDGDIAFENDLATDMTEGTLPDIITFDAPKCSSYAETGYLYDISELLSSEEKAKYLSLNTYKGKLYGIPIQESSAGFYYNKTIFHNAGLDYVSNYTVQNPWTFDEFKTVCETLKNAGGVTRAVDMRLDTDKSETATYLLYPFIYAAGGSFVDEIGLQAMGYFNSNASKDGFRFIRELQDAGYTGRDIGATDFFTGKVGMYLSSGWTIPDLDNKFPTTFGNHDRSKWGILPYPKSVKAASATGSWSFAITANKRKDKTLVVELLKFLTNPTSSKLITDHTGMIPANKEAPVEYKAGDPEKVLYDQLQTTGKERPVTIGYSEFTESFRQVISEMSGPTKTKDDVNSIVDNKARVFQDGLDLLK